MLARPLLLGLLAIVVAAAVYRRGPHGGFTFDDKHSIVENPNVYARDFSADQLSRSPWCGEAGPLRRPVSMASYALKYHPSGVDLVSSNVTNVASHPLHYLGIGALTWLTLRIAGGVSPWHRWPICLAASAPWLLCPCRLTGVFYLLQRILVSVADLSMMWGYERNPTLQSGSCAQVSSHAFDDFGKMRGEYDTAAEHVKPVVLGGRDTPCRLVRIEWLQPAGGGDDARMKLDRVHDEDHPETWPGIMELWRRELEGGRG
jgi:hypothetical protein